MKLLLIAPEVNDISEVKNFSGVWSFYLSRALRQAGVEIRYDPPLHGTKLSDADIIQHYRTLDLDGIDHVLALGTRYFTRITPGCARLIRDRFSGTVTQVHDTPVTGGGVDVTFTLGEGKHGSPEPSQLVGWAADPDLCTPRQNAKVLGILVDHADYVERRGELSNEILNSAQAMIASGIWKERFDAVKLWRIADGAFVEHDGSTVGIYKRKAIPFVKACQCYGRAHVFLVTHRESVGLTVLETAMAGALPVTPRGYIPKDRLRTVRHISWVDQIPWRQVIKDIDVATSRRIALANSWERVAATIVEWFRAR